MQNTIFYSLAQTAQKKLLIAAEKLNFENINDVIRAYRKYFQKIVEHYIYRIKSSIH